MKALSLSIALSLFSLSFPGVLGGPLAADDSGCAHGTIVSEFHIGEHKNVKVKRTSCAESPIQARALDLEARQQSTVVSSVVPTVVPPLSTVVSSAVSTATVVPPLSSISAVSSGTTVLGFSTTVSDSALPSSAASTSIASILSSAATTPTAVTSTSAPLPTSTGINVCGAQCTTNCFTPSGGGPDPNDCHVIADALRYDSQNVGLMFGIPSGPTDNPVVMTYKSCETFFVNQFNQDLVYCRTDWAAVIDFVAPNCQATQNAHGGNCVAGSGEWFIQVQHS